MNGRGVWNYLIEHFEEAIFCERMVQEAGQAIRSAIYTEPKCNFMFGNYNN